MSFRKDIEANIRQVWGDKPHRKLCAKVISYCFSKPDNELQNLTFSAIANICNEDNVSQDLIESINFLCGAKAPVLEIGFFFTDCYGEEHLIPNSDIAEAEKTGHFYHPDTGEEVIGYDEQIYPFFQVSSVFKERRNS